jgi:lipopolysaccharide/colanic/teichoic acid biosynthesis glycosyltransferase
MKNNILKLTPKFISQLFQIAVALWFLRMVLPGVKYLFVPSLIALVAFSLFTIKGSLFSRTYIFEFLKTFNPLIFLGIFFIVGFFISDSLYDRPLRDFAEYIINLFFLAIFFALTYYSRQAEGFFWVFRRMSRVIWVTSIFVAILGLIKYAMQVSGLAIPLDTPWGTSINEDKNFYALYSFLGLVGLYPRISKEASLKDNLVTFVLVFILIVNVIFSYSTRSILLLTVLFVILLILQLSLAIKRKAYSQSVLTKNLQPITFLIAVFFLVASWAYQTRQPFADRWISNYFGDISSIESINYDFLAQKAYQFEKWEFAITYFQNQGTLQKIFGGGFEYLEAFGKEFHGDSSQPDYPHNPVLSGLLYSGILGAIFIVFFLFVSFYYSVLYFKKQPLFAMMLFVCTLFIFFSGNSLFSVPVFLFLFSLSFLIRHQEISELKLVPNLSKPGSKFIKEIFDYFLATLAIVVLSPLLLIVIILVGFTMGWPVVYTQVRIGQNGKPFKLHKFRSMKKAKSNTTVAAQEQNRITWVGKFMRKYKLDELPELWNIIRGDMSFVGPRPDVPGYADALVGEDRIILQLKPGLTGAASLKYMHEEELLAKQSNPQEYNDTVVFPDKVLVNRKYMQKWTLWLDLKIIALTAMGKSMHEDNFL